MSKPEDQIQPTPLQALATALATDDLPLAATLARELASAGALPLVELFNMTQRLVERNLAQHAIGLYQLWLEHTASPLAYAVYFNLGATLSNANDDVAAEQAYRSALSLKPDFIEANLNLGTLQERQGQPELALETWRKTLDIINPEVPADRPFYTQTLNNLGRLLEIRKRYPEAEGMLRRSLEMDPKQPNAITHWVHLRQKQCKWPIYDHIEGLSTAEMVNATSALAMLSASDDPAAQLAAARRHVEAKVLSGVAPLSTKTNYGHRRLRIGYLSSDFCAHAVSILTAELFELHDRDNVEVYGFCWSREDASPLRARVVGAMDHHIRIGAMSDEQAAHCIRNHEIDILIDLHGLTLGTRPDILAYRPAPLQITYLGFPGPTALPSIDYVLADEFVLPPELAPFFTEKPLYLPRTFQINDRQRPVGPTPTKASCNLPENSFIFCSFNNNHKITPDVFSSWMRILKRVPDSVLWLVSDGEQVRDNLSREAEAQGIARTRLIFAGRVMPADYLARFRIADLFLDTLPFNGGTTASDALWAGLPLLTCAGKTFAARMAGSLLMATDLPQLITHSLQEYEDKAVELAEHPEQIAAMKQQLVDKRLSCALFDSPRFVRDLEALFRKIVDDLPAAPQTASADQDLAYLEAPYGKPNLDKPQDPSGRRYVIAAPPFQHNSAGIRVLYDLQKWLVRAGQDAIVCTYFSGYPVEQFEDDIVIYPEVAPGNLFNAKRVIRFILNTPGKLGHGEKTYDPREKLVAYNQELAHHANGVMLQVPSIEPFFYADDSEKTHDAVFVGKGVDLGLHPAGCIAITKTFPATRPEMAQLLRSVKTLYMYDDFSMISREALICGCDVKLIRQDGAIIDFPHQPMPTLEEFKVQLHAFIEMSKTL